MTRGTMGSAFLFGKEKKLKSYLNLSLLTVLIWSASASAKVIPSAFPKPRYAVRVTRALPGRASVVLKKGIQWPSLQNTLTFQEGRVTEEVQFFQSPRCYLHLKDQSESKGFSLNEGEELRIVSIDQIPMQSSVHTQFWFDSSQAISDLLCISNQLRPISAMELQSTLGDVFDLFIGRELLKAGLLREPPKTGFFSGWFSFRGPNPIEGQAIRFNLSN